MTAPDFTLFNAADFARRLKIQLGDRPARQVALAAGVSPATMSRVLSGWPELSHENWLRLERWMQLDQQERTAA